MHQKYLMIAVSFALLAGLLTDAQADDSVATSNTARIRVYQQGDITLYPGDICYGSAHNSAAIQAATSGFGIFNTHKREGMPETNDIPGAYNEYVIAAGQPVAVMLKWDGERNGVKINCGVTGSRFFLQAGGDYDLSVGYSGICFAQLRQLFVVAPGKAVAKELRASPTFACFNK